MKRSLYGILTFTLVGLLIFASIAISNEPGTTSPDSQKKSSRQNPLRKEKANAAPKGAVNTSAKPKSPIITASHNEPINEVPDGPFEELGNYDFGDIDNSENFDAELLPLDQALAEMDADSVPTLSISAPQKTPQSVQSAKQSRTVSPKVTRPITARAANTAPEAGNPVTQVDHTRETLPPTHEPTPIHPPTPFASETGQSAVPSSEPQWNESQTSPRMGSLERPSVHPPNTALSPSLQFSTLQPPVASSAPIPMSHGNALDAPSLNTSLNTPPAPEGQHEFYEIEQRASNEPEGIGMPGESTLFGIQAPIMEIEKIAPQEVQLNQPTIFKTIIRNKGLTTAKDIILQDKIPRGTRLLSTHPALANGSGGDLYWSLGSLAPQEEIAVEMKLVPLVEGEFGSVATVHFATEASSVSVATQAMLQLEVSSKPTVLIGEKITYNLTISNPGTGTATGVVLELDVPDGLQHPQGKRIQSPVGSLKAKETKQFPLTLLGTAPGMITTQIHARGDNNLESTATADVEVLAPDLQLQIAGPRQRFLDRKASYTLSVKNPGSAPAHSVDLVVKLPHGIKFESTNQKGVYNEKGHSIHWTLKELPARDAGEIELVLVPIREGEHLIRFEGIGEKNLKVETRHEVSVQGIPSIGFNVTCLTNPIEVGRTANYEVKLVNRGTKAASNVVVNVRLSEGMQYASADGATRHRTHSGVIQYEPIASLESKQEKIFRFSAKCLEIGDHRISVSVSSDELKAPVTKEESTLVYGDN